VTKVTTRVEVLEWARLNARRMEAPVYPAPDGWEWRLTPRAADDFSTIERVWCLWPIVPSLTEGGMITAFDVDRWEDYVRWSLKRKQRRTIRGIALSLLYVVVTGLLGAALIEWLW
jgi:hypothetical protein